MAGPCLSVFLPQSLSSTQEAQVHALITSLAHTVEGRDFWICGCPFFVDFRAPDEYERSLVVNGWNPVGSVSYCAMCNGQTDHVLLALLCHRTAELLGGLIDLGDISTFTDSACVLTFEGHKPIPDHGYVVTPDFLSYWMGEPNFRLIK